MYVFLVFVHICCGFIDSTNTLIAAGLLIRENSVPPSHHCMLIFVIKYLLLWKICTWKMADKCIIKSVILRVSFTHYGIYSGTKWRDNVFNFVLLPNANGTW